MTATTLAFRYTVFAVIATLANLAVQRLVLAADAGLILAISVGTLVGLVVKYVLDKKWIFFDQSAGLAAHGQKFSLYTLMGVATTAIFWAMESGFWFIWQTDLMREVGAVIGLAIGYTVKYRLDQRFVFTDARLEAA